MSLTPGRPVTPPEPNAMKRDWDERARENAMHYIANGVLHWDPSAFSQSGRESTDAFIRQDPMIPHGRDAASLCVLELGCGIGRMTEHLAAIFAEVHGVDVSGEMVRRGRDRLRHLPNVTLHETNGRDLAALPDAFFDFAFSFIVFQHIPERDVVVANIREIHRVLKAGRIFKFQVQGTQDPHYNAMPKDTWHGVAFSEAEMRTVASQCGFTVADMEGQGTQYFWQWWVRD